MASMVWKKFWRVDSRYNIDNEFDSTLLPLDRVLKRGWPADTAGARQQKRGGSGRAGGSTAEWPEAHGTSMQVQMRSRLERRRTVQEHMKGQGVRSDGQEAV